MIYKKIIVFLFLIFFINLVYTQEANNFNNTEEKNFTEELTISYFYNNLNIFKDKFNESVDKIPNFIKFFYKNSNYRLILIEDNENTYEIFAEFNGEYLENLTSNKPKGNIDLSIYIKEEVFNSIMHESDIENRLIKLKQHIKNKDIIFTPHGFFNKLKYSLLIFLK